MNLFENISRQIVCPMKMRYCLYDLGPTILSHGRRHDFTCHNPQNQKIYASFYSCSLPLHPDICVLYLHSMNGSRLQSSTYVDVILKMGVSFCSFDFSGCGNSEGDSISFGANEKHDVAAVIEVLKQKFKVKKYVLWGRSMGSAAALKYCEYLTNQQLDYKSEITAVILDSCFKSFSKLAVEIGTNHSQVPEFLVKLGYQIIKGSLQYKGKFKAEQLQFEGIVQNIDLPMLFLTSQDDKTVSSEHSRALFQRAIHSRKQLAYFTGAHNEARDQLYLSEVKNYIQKSIEHCLMSSKARMGPSRPFQINPAKRFPDDSIEFQEDATTCHCSFFGSNGKASDVQITDGVPTTRRKFSQTSLHSVKSHRRQFQFRSTSNISVNYH